MMFSGGGDCSAQHAAESAWPTDGGLGLGLLTAGGRGGAAAALCLIVRPRRVPTRTAGVCVKSAVPKMQKFTAQTTRRVAAAARMSRMGRRDKAANLPSGATAHAEGSATAAPL